MIWNEGDAREGMARVDDEAGTCFICHPERSEGPMQSAGRGELQRSFAAKNAAQDDKSILLAIIDRMATHESLADVTSFLIICHPERSEGSMQSAGRRKLHGSFAAKNAAQDDKSILLAIIDRMASVHPWQV